jgi:hypothetical protein
LLSFNRTARGFLDRSKTTQFLIGPTNSAKQATEWSRALSTLGFSAESLRISADPQAENFHTDILLSRQKWLPIARRQQLAEYVASNKDVVLIESLSNLFSLRTNRVEGHPILDDLTLLRRMHKQFGVIFHGSDIRDVDAHAARIPFSPFATPSPEVENLRSRSAKNRSLLPELRRQKVPIFVSTIDLFKEIPDSTWLPVTIDFPKFAAISKTSPIYSHGDPKLKVLFLPSRSWIKSAELIEPTLRKLDAAGLITYVGKREDGISIPHDEIPALLGTVDVVVDQLLGVIGVFAIEALAAGRIVMSYIPDELHKLGQIPIQNITPDTLEAELRRTAIERPLPAGGVEFAKRWHDGTESARVLAQRFGLKTPLISTKSKSS